MLRCRPYSSGGVRGRASAAGGDTAVGWVGQACGGFLFFKVIFFGTLFAVFCKLGALLGGTTRGTKFAYRSGAGAHWRPIPHPHNPTSFMKPWRSSNAQNSAGCMLAY